MANLAGETAGYYDQLDQDYNPRQMVAYDREYTGLESDYQSRTIMVETEYLIEEKFGKQ